MYKRRSKGRRVRLPDRRWSSVHSRCKRRRSRGKRVRLPDRRWSSEHRRSKRGRSRGRRVKRSAGSVHNKSILKSTRGVHLFILK